MLLYSRKKTTSRKSYKAVTKHKLSRRDSDPRASPQNVSVSFTAADISRWYAIFNCRYFYHADLAEYVLWHDNFNSDGQLLLESLIKIKTTTGLGVSISLFHTTGRIRIQGPHFTEWTVEGEYEKLARIYTSCSTKEEIEAECRRTFEGKNAGNDFIMWSDVGPVATIGEQEVDNTVDLPPTDDELASFDDDFFDPDVLCAVTDDCIVQVDAVLKDTPGTVETLPDVTSVNVSNNVLQNVADDAVPEIVDPVVISIDDNPDIVINYPDTFPDETMMDGDDEDTQTVLNNNNNNVNNNNNSNNNNNNNDNDNKFYAVPDECSEENEPKDTFFNDHNYHAVADVNQSVASNHSAGSDFRRHDNLITSIAKLDERLSTLSQETKMLVSFMITELTRPLIDQCSDFRNEVAGLRKEMKNILHTVVTQSNMIRAERSSNTEEISKLKKEIAALKEEFHLTTRYHTPPLRPECSISNLKKEIAALKEELTTHLTTRYDTPPLRPECSISNEIHSIPRQTSAPSCQTTPLTAVLCDQLDMSVWLRPSVSSDASKTFPTSQPLIDNLSPRVSPTTPYDAASCPATSTYITVSREQHSKPSAIYTPASQKPHPTTTKSLTTTTTTIAAAPTRSQPAYHAQRNKTQRPVPAPRPPKIPHATAPTPEQNSDVHIRTDLSDIELGPDVRRRTNTRKKKKILVLMDSNRNNINFENLFHDDDVHIEPCGTVQYARGVVASMKTRPDVILVHLGTNDLKSHTPGEFFNNLTNLVSDISNKWDGKVIVSDILPRCDKFEEKVTPTNTLLAHSIPISNRVIHDEISRIHLHDKVHLSRNVSPNNKYSGTQLLAKGFYRSVYGRDPIDSRISRSLNGDLIKKVSKLSKNTRHSSRNHGRDNNYPSKYGPPQGTRMYKHSRN